MDALTELQIDELLSGDIIGKIQPPSRDRCVYFYWFVDKRSGCMKAYTAKTKDGFVKALEDVIKCFAEQGYEVNSFNQSLSRS